MGKDNQNQGNDEQVNSPDKSEDQKANEALNEDHAAASNDNEADQ